MGKRVVLVLIAAGFVAAACPAAAGGREEMLIGNWSCDEGPCSDEEIAFSIEDGRATYSSWLHDRPSAVDGDWKLDGDSLSVECCEGMRFDWTIVQLTSMELVMREVGDTEDTLFRRILPRSEACSTPAHKEFDFWIGRWNVTTPDGKPAGTSRIQKILGGCVIFENWTSATSVFAGKSFNTWDPVTGTWNQVWVDTGGATIHFHGRRKGNVMDMEGEQVTSDGTLKYRLSFTLNGDGSIRQWWQQSRDGKGWETIFDGLYTRN